VTAAISGDGVYSFALTKASSNATRFSSKEAGTNQPVLVITVSN